ncbi:Dipeptidyl aminopeptidase/acylaminoacyl peptidase [Gracilimonas mengyeensis]|uniref:Dipeptidyl aminopeptidase/acylaminoacyl peptidase n=1 Tax=Gracilimonas mengyeensis TaxID=1302730 RepID=A0A521DPA1_9BACT|nr:Dipeptidyl aminopeptidase/acylaminoacyl peptidase [Gracilimonas mengyeensis]
MLIVLGFIFSTSLKAQGVLTFQDVMKFEDIGDIELSADGSWVAYEVWPDRGDGVVEVKSTDGRQTFTINLGASPKITPKGKWVAAERKVPLADQLKDSKDKPQPGLSVLSTADGGIVQFDSVKAFQFSEDGKWLAIHHLQSKEVEELKSENKKLGSELVLRELESGTEFSFPFVHEVAFDSLSNYLAYSVVDTTDEENGLFLFDLNTEETIPVDASASGYYTNLTWDYDQQKLAFTKASYDTSYVESDASLHVWNAENESLTTLFSEGDASDEFVLRSNNELTFTNDGNRLFFGLMDAEMAAINAQKEEENETPAVYDVNDIVEERGLDIWHGDDSRIKPHEKKSWESRKNHLYTAVYLLDKNEWVQLADHEMPDLRVAHNPDVVLGSSQEPYLKEMTWEGFFNDWYHVDLETGERKLIAEKLSEGAYLSPGGKFVVYYADKDWHLLDIGSGESRNLTGDLEVPFYDEDHDYPSRVPDYGLAGWIEDDRAVLIYDKYDVWRFETNGGEPKNITGGEGRENKRIFRIERMNKKWDEAFANNEELLLTSYHDLNKNFGFYSAHANRSGASRLLEEDKKFTFVEKAKDANAVLYKREAYDEFPNIWVANNWEFKQTEQLTILHDDLKEKWNWGSAELIDWRSVDGTFIQGIVIKPDNYDPEKRYPIMTYYYRFFTNRLHDFNEPKTNHRPVFAQYVSDGYVVFLPDIRFEIGRPGFAATKSLVPGIQKLIEMGIADEDKLGLHGHSWSGYQTAFMVTQTDIFDAAVSGAPVSNMTSAYSGIRWGSGLARQFQYEKTQSRIGETLVDAPLKYIENSPVFYADRIKTPMLIMHGDADGAVPWYQSIELYLAMRRYNKDVVFLQYHDEPHHPQKFPNKLDYAIRMKEYFDYYLKGVGQPDWILEGEAYSGE